MRDYNGIKLPYLISDGMILQRDCQVKIWGGAAPSQKLTLLFCNKEYTAITGTDGNWEIIMEGLKAGGPYDLNITCGNSRAEVREVMIGDVWVLGGQSNMEMPFERSLDLFEEELKQAEYPCIRKFAVPEAYDFHGPREELDGGGWIPVTPETVSDFSAAGYFFAKRIYEKYKIPIGLIHTAVGGTPAQAWLSEAALAGFPRFHDLLVKYKEDNYVQSIFEKDAACTADWYGNLNGTDLGLQAPRTWYDTEFKDSDWKEMNLPASFKDTELEKLRGAVWFRKEFFISGEMKTNPVKLVLGTIINGDDTYINGVKIGSNDSLFARRRYEVPKGVLKPGKNLLAVRVIITRHMGAFVTDMPYFLQSGDSRIPLSGTWRYRIGAVTGQLAPTETIIFKPVGAYNSMIYPLRKYALKGVLWYQGESNTDYTEDYTELFEAVIKTWRSTWNLGDFPFLYVQLANYCPWRMEPEISKWAQIREAQRKALKITGTGMAVICDAGEYNDIHPRDKKTVGDRLAFLAMNLVYGEDMVSSGPLYQHKVIEGNKIRLYFTGTGRGLKVKGERLETFAVSVGDGVFADADAFVDGNTVVVSCDAIKAPAEVRYAWSDNPEAANLYNEEGFPASPFTTES